MHYVSAQFDRIRNIDSFLPQNLWKECHRCLSRVVSALDAERDIKLGALKTDDMAATAVLHKAMSKADETKAEVKTEDGGETKKEEAPMTVVGASAQDDQLDIDASGVLHVPVISGLRVPP